MVRSLVAADAMVLEDRIDLVADKDLGHQYMVQSVDSGRAKVSLSVEAASLDRNKGLHRGELEEGRLAAGQRVIRISCSTWWRRRRKQAVEDQFSSY